MTAEIKTSEKQVCLDHEKLTVYQAAIEFVILADEMIEHLPPGRAYLKDQLQRAAVSIPLNIAEGAGEFAVNEKIRFYRIARRSATECAGVLRCLPPVETYGQELFHERARIIDQYSFHAD